MKELNNTIQDLKTEVETIKKTQSDASLEIENLGKNSGVIDACINNRIQEIEERISDDEDTIENIDSTVKENAKCKKIATQYIKEIQDTMRRPNLRIMGIEKCKDLHLEEPVNIFNKVIEEALPNLKKEIPMIVQEV